MSKTPPPGGLGAARIVRNGLGHTVVWVQAYSAILERETPHSLPVACKSGQPPGLRIDSEVCGRPPGLLFQT